MDNNMTFLNACRNGQKSIVQIFLQKGGINVNKRDAEGNTPLHYACLKGFRDIVNMLLEHDADVSVANNCAETPLHAAARSGNKEIIGKLIQYGADQDATDKDGRTPLICLLDNKRTDAALFLIEQGADTEMADNTGHKAIQLTDCVKLWHVCRRREPLTRMEIRRFIRRFSTDSRKRYVCCFPLRMICWIWRMMKGKRH